MNATRQPFFEIGRVGKSHGLKGEVKIDFILDDFELISDLKLVYLKSPGGEMIPYRISNARFSGNPSNPSFFVLFEKIDDRNKADSIRDCSLLIEESGAEEWMNIEEDAPFMHYEVVDQERGSIGEVNETMETAAHLILICSSEAGDIMIPFVEEYVVSVDDENEIIHCMNLDQLMEE